MLNSSKDILYLVISFCIIWVTVFLCWMFYYLMRIFKDTSKIVEEFRVRLQSLTEMIKGISEKVEKVYGIVNLVSNGVGNFMNRKSRKREENEDDDEEKETFKEKTHRYEEAAKDAVDRAVEATADKMRKIAKKIRK